MKKLRALALSDLHLGEKDTLLYDNKYGVIEKTVKKINGLSIPGTNEDLESGIEELILLGDIVDLSEAKDEEAYANTKRFLTDLLDEVKIEKIVFIPGNHDHHIWIETLKTELNITQCSSDTQMPELPFCVKDPAAFIQNCLPLHHPPVVLRYPYYLLEEGNLSILFDHGHLFSTTLKALSQFPFVRYFFRFSKKTTDADSLRELEKIACPFIEWIWHPRETSWLGIREWIYDISKRIFLRLMHGSTLGNTFREDSRPIYDDTLLEQIRWYLLTICEIPPIDIYEKDFHFVFGHTHIGGRVLKADRRFRMNGPFISVWNTGGWLVPSEAFSPNAYLFYVERNADKLEPNVYKMVRIHGKVPVGDYDERLLSERLGHL